ncbi:MAG: hypothetical protein QXL17_06935 [Candidatus Thermoplasmatota archaeon]
MNQTKKILSALVLCMLVFGATISAVSSQNEKEFDDDSNIVCDQTQYEGLDGEGYPVTAFTECAQSFTPMYSRLVYASVALILDSQSTGNIVLSIRSCLDGNDLTSVMIPIHGFAPQTPGEVITVWIPFDFPDITVIRGATYYIVLRGNESTAIAFWNVGFETQYTNGRAFINPNGEGWQLPDDSLDFDFCFETYRYNDGPTVFVIDCPAVIANVTYPIYVNALDPENDRIYYLIDFGDGTYGTNNGSIFFGPFDSGRYVFLTNHQWMHPGSYTIRVGAVDSHGAVTHFNYTHTIRIYRLGDTNGDDQVNFDDIDPFIRALTSLEDYYSHPPYSHHATADINRDDVIDFRDIPLFSNLIQ